MAPKAMKRPAAAAAAPPAKKTRLSAEMKEKCSEVAEAINAYEGLPDSVREMLCACIKDTLPIMKDDRHQYQTNLVEMIAEALAGAETAYAKEIEAIQEKVDGADAEKATLEESEKAAEAELEKLKGLTSTAKEASAAASNVVKEVTAALELAKTEQAAGDVLSKKLAEEKEKLQHALNDIFVPLKTAAASKEDLKKLKVLEKVCKEFKYDSSMMDSAMVALKEDPASRSTFGKMVEKQLEEQLTASIQKVTSDLDECAPAKAARAEAVAAKEAELLASAEKSKAAKEALDGAKSAEAEGVTALADKKKALASFTPELKKACKSLDTAKKAFEAFKKGPLATFKSLQELAPPPPEPEPVPEPEVAADQIIKEGAVSPPVLTKFLLTFGEGLETTQLKEIMAKVSALPMVTSTELLESTGIGMVDASGDAVAAQSALQGLEGVSTVEQDRPVSIA